MIKLKLHFSCGKADISELMFVCKGEHLEIVHCFKYLGIIMNYNGSFKMAIQERQKQANHAIIAILCTCRKSDLPVDITLFDTLVAPVMLYSCVYSSVGV